MEKYKKNISIIVGVILILNTIALAVFVFGLKSKINAGYESNKPVELNAVIIKEQTCGENCFDIDKSYLAVKQSNVTILDKKVLDRQDSEAQELIKKYNIKKIPTIVFTGEIKRNDDLVKAWGTIGEIKDDAVVFTKLTPPYFDIDSGEIAGKVDITYINDKSCEKCVPFGLYVAKLKEGGLKVFSEKSYDYADSEAKALIEKYNITKIPVFIASPSLKIFEDAVKNWSRVGTVEKDGSYIFRNVDLFKGAMYRDLLNNKVITNKQ